MGPSLTKEEAHSKLHARCFEYAKRADGYRKFDGLFSNYNIDQEDVDRVLRKRDKEGDSVFMVACAHGNVRTARYLLQKAKTDPLARDYLFRMPVHLLQLDHLGKKSPKMLRHLENVISPFAAALKVECFSAVQTTIASYIGENSQKTLNRRLGRRWNTKWCVITRLRGSAEFAAYGCMRCPQCYCLNPHSVDACKNCEQALPPKTPKVQEKYSVLTIYDDETTTRPFLIVNLRGATVEYIERAKIIRIQLNSNLQHHPDPIVLTSPQLVRSFHNARKRLSTRGKDIIHLTAGNIMDVNNAFKALAGDTRQVPEPVDASTSTPLSQHSSAGSFVHRTSSERERASNPLPQQHQHQHQQQPWHQAHTLHSGESSYNSSHHPANMNHEIPYATVVDTGELELDYTVEEEEELGRQKQRMNNFGHSSPRQSQVPFATGDADTRVRSPTAEQKEENVVEPGTRSMSHRSTESNKTEPAPTRAANSDSTLQLEESDGAGAGAGVGAGVGVGVGVGVGCGGEEQRQQEVEALPAVPTNDPVVLSASEEFGSGGTKEGDATEKTRVATEL